MNFAFSDILICFPSLPQKISAQIWFTAFLFSVVSSIRGQAYWDRAWELTAPSLYVQLFFATQPPLPKTAEHK